MGKVFLFDAAKCNGCRNCQLACKDEHVDNEWAPWAKPQPDTGHFWCRIHERVRGQVPKVKVAYVAHRCQHCGDAPCMAAAPEAVYRRPDGLVIVDPEKAHGLRELVEACPYGAIYWNEELNLPQKCTGCAHLLDAGYKLPRCVEACPTDAIQFGEEEELADEILGAQTLKAEMGLYPQVYYRNVPGQFIAGTVYDPVAKEVIIGARVRANSGGKHLETFTDNYGDFWFKDLAIGTWDVYIEAKGFKLKSFPGLRTTECLNLGDIPLDKE